MSVEQVSLESHLSDGRVVIFSAIDTYLFKFGGKRENVFMSDIWVRKIEVSTMRLVPALSFYALTIEQNFVVPV